MKSRVKLNEKLKMKNDLPAGRHGKEKFKNEFKNRIYRFTLMLVEFIDNLPRSPVRG